MTSRERGHHRDPRARRRGSSVAPRVRQAARRERQDPPSGYALIGMRWGAAAGRPRAGSGNLRDLHEARVLRPAAGEMSVWFALPLALDLAANFGRGLRARRSSRCPLFRPGPRGRVPPSSPFLAGPPWRPRGPRSSGTSWRGSPGGPIGGAPAGSPPRRTDPGETALSLPGAPSRRCRKTACGLSLSCSSAASVRPSQRWRTPMSYGSHGVVGQRSRTRRSCW